MLVDLEGEASTKKTGGHFRIEGARLTHPKFEETDKQSWLNEDSCLAQKINNLGKNLKYWNTNFFGNIFKRKRRCLARLKWILKALATHYAKGLFLSLN